MKFLTRQFSRKEKVLIIIFVVILVVLAYYRFVDMNVREQTDAAKEAVEVAKSELEITNAQLVRLQSMDEELDSYEAGGASRLESYNNVKAELSLLDFILSSTSNYSISMQDPVLDGDLIRRAVAIQFTTDSFDSAMNVVRSFSQSNLRNIVQTISYSASTDREGGESVSVGMTVIFYETIVGGTPDAGLIMPEVETEAAATE